MRLHTLIAILAIGGAMAGTGAMLYVIRPHVPMVSDEVYGFCGALAVTVACSAAVMGVRRALGYTNSLGPAHYTPIPQPNIDYAEQRRARAAELAADPDPDRRKYAPLVAQGQLWSDAGIAYAEDRSLTVTCPHLHHVELAMRNAGVVVRAYPPNPIISAVCHLNEPSLRRNFVLAASVRYEEGFTPERQGFDEAYAELTCTACQSSINVIHPAVRSLPTPLFPAF